MSLETTPFDRSYITSYKFYSNVSASLYHFWDTTLYSCYFEITTPWCLPKHRTVYPWSATMWSVWGIVAHVIILHLICEVERRRVILGWTEPDWTKRWRHLLLPCFSRCVKQLTMVFLNSMTKVTVKHCFAEGDTLHISETSLHRWKLESLHWRLSETA